MRRQKKGENGKLLIVGGSDYYPGAVFLAGMAALRTGIDLVRICTPEKVAWTLNQMSPDLITEKLKGSYLNLKHLNIINNWIEWSDAILIGNGIGIKSGPLIKKLSRVSKPKIIDADALKYIDIAKINNALLTPHAKEYEYLVNNTTGNDLQENVILLKGPTDKIISSAGIKKIKGGNSGMTVGGTGDVLAGICAGYVCQGYDLTDSAEKSVRIMNKNADILYKEQGYSYIASDFIRKI